MKKLIAALFITMLCCAPAYAFEADVADFDIYFDGLRVNGQNTEYPPLVYKDVTYFPMTYEYVRRLRLTSSWQDGSFYLAKAVASDNRYTPEPAGPANTAERLECSVADYPIYLNGRLLDNSAEEYPILNCKGITYFPLTWSYATEEFDLMTEWDGSLRIYNRNSYAGILKTEGSRLYFYDENNAAFVFDADSGAVSEYSGEVEVGGPSGTDISSEFSLNGNRIVYDGEELLDVSSLVESSKSLYGEVNYAAKIHIEGMAYEAGGIRFIWVGAAVMYPAPVMGRGYDSQACFIDCGDVMIPCGFELGTHDSIHDIRVIGGQVYVSVVDNGGKYLGPYTYRLYRVSPDLNVVRITDPDHESIKLIGEMYGKPIVLATWKSEQTAVSAVNDGYFSVEPDGTVMNGVSSDSLRKFYPYVYSPTAFTYNDHLYLVLPRVRTILDTATGQEIGY